MELSLKFPEMLERLPCPAFVVEKGIILHANRAAEQRQLTPGVSIIDYIALGKEEYANFTNGELCLTLSLCDTHYSATVVNWEGAQVFYLDSDYQEPELQAFALAAQHLREPLANAMTCANYLMPDGDDELQKQLALLNKNLHQLHRAICNMSDAAQYQKARPSRVENREIGCIFNEIMEKAAQFIAMGSHKLTYTGLSKQVYTAVDAEKLERALLNMISNAAKFAPKDSEIRASLHISGNKLYFSVENENTNSPIKQASNIFAHYTREPGIESSKNGIGLGMSIVRKTAAAHGGTLLLEQFENAGVRFTMTIAAEPPKGKQLRSKVLLPVDYAGGYDHTLTELSDVLPAELYK